MKLLFIIYILIQYPCKDIETVRYYNQLTDEAFKGYCFLGVEFEFTNSKEKADLIIYPKFDFVRFPWYIGFTNGNILRNPKIYGKPEILISNAIDSIDEKIVLKHEFFHFFGGNHSLDTMSLMYETYSPERKELTRYDSLVLLNNLRGNSAFWQKLKNN